MNEKPAINTIEDLDKHFGKYFEIEPLVEELKKCLINKQEFSVLQHPLVVGIYAAPMAKHYNEALKHKQEVIKEAIEKKDIETYVFTHERPFRVIALTEGIAMMGLENTQKLAELVVTAWTDCEWPYAARDNWLMLFLRHVRGSHVQFEAAKKTPKTLYRGVNRGEGRRLGMSWTTDRDKAIWFAKRNAAFFDRRPVLYTVNPFKEDILAAYDDRGEDEFILDPRSLHMNRQLKISNITKVRK
jgi:hypothetical protein